MDEGWEEEGGGVKMLTIYNILILMFEVFSTL